MLKKITFAAGLALLLLALLLPAALAEDTPAHDHYATCQTPGVCAVCGLEDAALEGQHVYEQKKYGTDKYEHWLICDVCGSHNYDLDELHTATGAWLHNETEHYRTCSVCGVDYGHTQHYVDCKVPGVCYTCGRATTLEAQHNSRWTEWDNTYHVQVCIICLQVTSEKEPHVIVSYTSSDIKKHHVECSVCSGWSENHRYTDDTSNVCLDCGFDRSSYPHEHVYTRKQYGSDGTNHWLICDTCGKASTEVTAHSGEILYHNTEHYYWCSVCQTEYGYAAHTYEQKKYECMEWSHTPLCDVCGRGDYDAIASHTSTTNWESDGTNHWHVCDTCGEKYNIGTHEAYCTVPGICYTCSRADDSLEGTHDVYCKAFETYHQDICTFCKEPQSEAEPHVNLSYASNNLYAHIMHCDVCGSQSFMHRYDMNNPTACLDCGIPNSGLEESCEHQYGVKYGSDETNHWDLCHICCLPNSASLTAHTWVIKKTTATCTQAGETDYSCVCGLTKTEATAVLGHDWKEAERIDATCTDAGSVTRVCQRCNTSETEEIPAKNHDWKEAENIAPTCVSKGYIMTVCMNCSKTAVEEVAALGHDWYEAERVEATATEKGYIITACRNCSETTTQEIPTAAGHDWDESERVEATCTEKGYIVTACRHCAETTTQEIPVLSHVWEEKECVEPTCKDAGYTLSVCVNCGETVRTENADKVGHRWGKVEIVPATCTEKGSEKKTCTVCGTFTRKLTDPLGHEFSETGDSICARCGYEEAREEKPVAFEQPQGMEVVIAAFRAENPKAKVLHVAFDRNELPMQLAGTVRFTVPMNGEAFRLVQILESGEIVEIAYEIIDGNMVFEADILGYFALLPV